VLRVATLAAAAVLSSPQLAVQWRQSVAHGLPWAGTLSQGVRLPAAGPGFFTWDPLLHRRPDRPGRRWGTDRLVRTVLRVVADYRRAYPDAPPLGIGDLSRRHGGRFGILHVSHQNGLDVDVYYPRRDRRLRPPDRPDEIDRTLAQDLVDRFVHAGARLIFVGPRTGLHGPRRIVETLAHHDNHLHVRLPARDRGLVIARSTRGEPIRAYERGDPRGPARALVVGCIHGTECAGLAVTRLLLRAAPEGVDLWIVPNLNADGLAAGVRVNGRGVDLNRNWSAGWRAAGRRWDPEFPGLRPFSEPETRGARRLIERVRPQLTLWFHQPASLVRAWGGSVRAARIYAGLVGLPFRRLPWPAGTAPNWQNHRLPGTSSFVVELPPGRLAAGEASRYAHAALALAPRLGCAQC
jgi:hypothetical protein